MVFENQYWNLAANIPMCCSGKLLEKVKSFKYLGIYFSQNLNFNEHAKYVLVKAEKVAFLNWKYVGRYHSLSTYILLNLFNLKNLKKILGLSFSTANTAVYYELNQMSIEAQLESRILKFFT